MLTTQCPQCQTRFRVSDEQLAIADGFVRCGRCAHIFNARDALAPAAAPSPAPAPTPAPPPPRGDHSDDFELELPDFMPEADSTAQPAAEPQAEAPVAPAPAAATSDLDMAAAPATSNSELAQFQQALADALRAPRPESRPIELPAAVDTPLGDPFEQTPALRSNRAPKVAETEEEQATPVPADIAPAPRQPEDAVPLATPRRRSGYTTLLWAVGGVLGLIVLAAQLVYLNRTRIGAELPELRPTLEAACASLGCSVPLPTDRNLLRTEWSELSYVPDQPQLIQFTATLKNHARYPQAWPAMELTLTDSDDRVLVKRVFAPNSYLPKAEQGKPAIAAGSQIKVLLRLDAARLGQKNSTLGYSVNWLYP